MLGDGGKHPIKVAARAEHELDLVLGLDVREVLPTIARGLTAIRRFDVQHDAHGLGHLGDRIGA